MIEVCAWCKPWTPDQGRDITHGICPVCKASVWRGEWKPQPTRFQVTAPAELQEVAA